MNTILHIVWASGITPEAVDAARVHAMTDNLGEALSAHGCAYDRLGQPIAEDDYETETAILIDYERPR